MRSRIVFTILKKELKETLRDRRTLLMMIGLPVLVYPLLMIGLSRLQESQTEASEARASHIAVWGALPVSLATHLGETANIHVDAWAGADPSVQASFADGSAHPAEPIVDADDARRGPPPTARDTLREASNPVLVAARHALTSRTVDAVVVAWPGFAQQLDARALATTSIYFDSVRDDSRLARERLVAAMRTYRESVLDAREQMLELPDGFTTGVDIRQRDVAEASRRAAYALGSFLPFLIVSLSLFGGFYAAVDLTAGEKERGTMQTLLCAPVRSLEIVAGKFLAVWVVATVAALANIGSLAATMARILPAGATAVPPSTFVLTAIMLLPITLTVAALFVAIAAFAKDFKDGQNFLTPVYMFLALPAGITMLPSVELDAWTAFVPMINIALLVKSLLAGEARGELMFLVLASSALYAMLALVLAARVFDREQVLLGGKESARALLGFDRTPGGIPTPGVAIVLLAITLVLAFYVSLGLQSRGIITLLLITQYGIFLVPTLAAIALHRFDLRATLQLRVPSLLAVACGIALGTTAWIAVSAVTVRLMPPPESLTKAMERFIQLGDSPQPLWIVWLVIAITPAICEETLFRGFILSGFRRAGKWPAILGSALLFGLAHASIYRLLPTMLLGIILAYVAWQTRSLIPGIVIHALNNGLVATIAQRESWARALGFSDTSQTPSLPVIVGAAVVTIATLGIVSRMGDSPRRSAASHRH